MSSIGSPTGAISSSANQKTRLPSRNLTKDSHLFTQPFAGCSSHWRMPKKAPISALHLLLHRRSALFIIFWHLLAFFGSLNSRRIRFKSTMNCTFPRALHQKFTTQKFTTASFLRQQPQSLQSTVHFSKFVVSFAHAVASSTFTRWVKLEKSPEFFMISSGNTVVKLYKRILTVLLWQAFYELIKTNFVNGIR